jgi:hypothetical protein
MGTGAFCGMAGDPLVGSQYLAPHRCFQRSCVSDHTVDGHMVSAIGCCPFFLFPYGMDIGRSRLQQEGLYHVAEHRVDICSGSRCGDCVVLCDPLVKDRSSTVGVTSLLRSLTPKVWVYSLDCDTLDHRKRRQHTKAVDAISMHNGEKTYDSSKRNASGGL